MLTLRSAKAELDAKLRKKEVIIEHLERDRRWPSEREQEEWDTKEQAERNAEDQKVCGYTILLEILLDMPLVPLQAKCR